MSRPALLWAIFRRPSRRWSLELQRAPSAPDELQLVGAAARQLHEFTQHTHVMSWPQLAAAEILVEPAAGEGWVLAG